MPYGLTGATQTCQHALDEVFRECHDCVDNYVDDIIVFSDNMESHKADLRRVLQKLKLAGFTLWGSSSTTYLGFQYSPQGVTPSQEKTKAIAEWPVPQNIKELRSFLGLANFYRNFVPGFADISAPLTDLRSSKATFTWEAKHQSAFDTLKQSLMSPPILDYPRKHDHFTLTTDASDVGLGAVLSTPRNTVIEFASRALTSAERNYTTTEKECLAIIWATRKFRHYLLGSSFTLETDHKPLEWLESHKQSHAHSQRLQRWSLELRAYDFHVVYRPGANNQCADSLSRYPVSLVGTQPEMTIQQIATAQEQDPVLSTVCEQLKTNPQTTPLSSKWQKYPLRRYKQLWSQLTLTNSVLYRRMKSPTMVEKKLLIVVPQSMQKSFLEEAHDYAGHQGTERTLARLLENAYWVGMAKDVGQHCKHCVRCQVANAQANKPASLQPVIASRLWEMVAVDILKVPPSLQGNQYILVAQDYFSKWPFAWPMADQKAERIIKILRDHVFTVVGPPERLHSDQGRNFESHILTELCRAFNITKSLTTPYHPMGDGLVERTNRTLLSLLRTYTQEQGDWEEHLQLLLFIYRTTKHSSTGLSPHEILFGHNPPSQFTPNCNLPEMRNPMEYSDKLQRKILELREWVDANITESAMRQQSSYHSGTCTATSLVEGQKVLVDNPTRHKLDPKWTGPWIVQKVIDATSVRVKKDAREQIVHINRICPLLQEDFSIEECQTWSPPLFTHTDSTEGVAVEDDCSDV